MHGVSSAPAAAVLRPAGYDADGVVLKLDDAASQAALGLDGGGRDPRWAVAWKFPAKEAVTRVTGISWSVGRTGTVRRGVAWLLPAAPIRPMLPWLAHALQQPLCSMFMPAALTSCCAVPLSVSPSLLSLSLI